MIMVEPRKYIFVPCNILSRNNVTEFYKVWSEFYQHKWLEVDEYGLCKIVISESKKSIANEATEFAHVWQISLILHLFNIFLSNLVHIQDNQSDDKGKSLCVDKVPNTNQMYS